MALTDMAVRNARPRDKVYKLTDDHGLRLTVKPNGSRLWQMRYWFETKEKLLSFGRYPIVSLADARVKTLAARQLLLNGVDPGAQRRATLAAEARTFEAVCRAWHELRKHTLSPEYEKRLVSRLEDDVFPAIGAVLINRIDPPMVLAVVQKIEQRGALEIAKRMRVAVDQTFRFAISQGWVPMGHNPAESLVDALTPAKKRKNMTRLPVADMPIFLRDLDGYGDEAQGASTKLAIILTILTWVRTSETRFAARSEFEDLDGQLPLWRIPKDRMKMDREHLIPLPKQAIPVIKQAMALSKHEELLFPGHGDGISQTTMLQALYKLGYKGRATMHGFRGMASTWANDELLPSGDRKYDPDWIEMQLAHAEANEVRGSYNSALYLAPRKRMLQDWADLVDQHRAAEVNEFDILLG